MWSAHEGRAAGGAVAEPRRQTCAAPLHPRAGLLLFRRAERARRKGRAVLGHHANLGRACIAGSRARRRPAAAAVAERNDLNPLAPYRATTTVFPSSSRAPQNTPYLAARCVLR